MDEITIPFEIDDVYSGFAECKGVIMNDNRGIILEFETVDALFKIIKSGVKEVLINFANISSIEFKKGFFSTKIIITTKRIRNLKNIPGCDNNTIRLKIKKSNQNQARLFVSIVNLQISENKLKNIENDN